MCIFVNKACSSDNSQVSLKTETNQVSLKIEAN